MIARRTVGSATVTVLGVASLERTLDELSTTFPEADRAEIEALVVEPVTWSFNLLLISIPGTTILVDTGFGFASGGPGASTRRLLEEAAVAPSAIDIVLITHAHGDHIGGLLDDGRPAFENARLWMARPEHAFWCGGASGSPAPERSGPVVEAVEAYSDRLTLFDPGAGVAEGGGARVRSVALPGHTPGHVGVEVVSGPERLVALVDTLHAEMQLARPDWSPRFDADPARAQRTREAALERYSADRTVVHFYHLGFPGLGTVERLSSGAYRWVRLE